MARKPSAIAVTRYYLWNRYGWLLTYSVAEGTVTLRRTFHGQPAGNDLTLTRDEARTHYARQLESGFETPAGDL